MKKTSILTAILLLIATTAMAFDQSQFSSESFTVGNNTLLYRCSKICQGTSKPILVLYLHGGTSRGSDNLAQLNEAAVGEIYQYLVDHNIPSIFIVPQCPSGGSWTTTLRRVVNELLLALLMPETLIPTVCTS